MLYVAGEVSEQLARLRMRAQSRSASYRVKQERARHRWERWVAAHEVGMESEGERDCGDGGEREGRGEGGRKGEREGEERGRDRSADGVDGEVAATTGKGKRPEDVDRLRPKDEHMQHPPVREESGEYEDEGREHIPLRDADVHSMDHAAGHGQLDLHGQRHGRMNLDEEAPSCQGEESAGKGHEERRRGVMLGDLMRANRARREGMHSASAGSLSATGSDTGSSTGPGTGDGSVASPCVSQARSGVPGRDDPAGVPAASGLPRHARTDSTKYQGTSEGGSRGTSSAGAFGQFIASWEEVSQSSRGGDDWRRGEEWASGGDLYREARQAGRHDGEASNGGPIGHGEPVGHGDAVDAVEGNEGGGRQGSGGGEKTGGVGAKDAPLHILEQLSGLRRQAGLKKNTA